MDSFESLRQYVNSIHPFSDTEWDMFAALWKHRSAKRKEQLTVPGRAENRLYFVCGGIQRIYYCDDAGREATLVFTYAPSFGGVIDSLLTHTPSKYYYETLTASVFLEADFRQIENLARNVPSVDALIKKACYQTLAGVLERLVEVQCYPSEQRFRTLLERSPHILTLIPHKYIANYLGIDAGNFSKFINKIRI